MQNLKYEIALVALEMGDSDRAFNLKRDCVIYSKINRELWATVLLWAV